jgi:hypothetical protein
MMALTFDQEADFKMAMLQVSEVIGECFVLLTRKGIDPIHAADLVKHQFATMMGVKFPSNNAVHLTPAADGSCATDDTEPQAQVTADR